MDSVRRGSSLFHYFYGRPFALNEENTEVMSHQSSTMRWQLRVSVLVKFHLAPILGLL